MKKFPAFFDKHLNFSTKIIIPANRLKILDFKYILNSQFYVESFFYK